MATTAGQVVVPSQVASTQITPNLPGPSSKVWLYAAGPGVFIGPTGVTPQTGFPLPKNKQIGPFEGTEEIHGVVGEGQQAVAVCFFQATTT
jgi:hypothetical protein